MYGSFAWQLNINYALNQNKWNTLSDQYKHYHGNAFDLNNYYINAKVTIWLQFE